MDVFFQRGSDELPANVTDNNATSAGPLACNNIKVLEYLYTGKTIFEKDVAGLAKRFIMEVSPELVDSEAAKMNAKAGMICFEKS